MSPALSKRIEVIESDFARLEAETSTSESESQAEFERFSDDSAQDKAVKSTDLYLSNFSCCTPVFFAILVILHTCIFRDARCASERERSERERKIAKSRTAHDCSRIARARYPRASRKIQVCSD